MSLGSVNFNSSNMFPLTHSVMFERPYLSMIRHHQKKKKPQFSKLSILTKTSIGSTKITSNEFKKHKLQKKVPKQAQKKQISHYVSTKQKRKMRSNSYENRMAKTVKPIQVQQLGLSYQPEQFNRFHKNTPISRTVYKRHEVNSISPLYSSLIFNSAHENESPDAKNKQLQKILDRTVHILSTYKEECQQLKRQRDSYKKKLFKANSKLNRLEKQRNRDRSRI